MDDTVVFPGMSITLPVDVGDDDRVLLVPRHDHTYAKVGVVAEVTERVRLAGRGSAVSLTGLHRAALGGAAADADGVLRVDVEARPGLTAAAGRSPASSSANTAPSSRRFSSCAATTDGSARSSGRSPTRARWPTPPATRPT